MKKDGLSKGVKSRLMIIDEARKIYNTFGLELRIKDLSEKMVVNQSKITNHFQTKELVIQAIAAEYEEAFLGLVEKHSKTGFTSLAQVAEFTSALMELQLNYRCAIIYYMNVMVFSDAEKSNIQKQNEKRLKLVQLWIKNLTDSGELDASTADAENNKLLVHQVIILMTNWVNSYMRYEQSQSFKKIKPFYLKSILSIFAPYLTKKGKKAYDELNFADLAKK